MGVPSSQTVNRSWGGFLVTGIVTANALPSPTKPVATEIWLQKSAEAEGTLPKPGHLRGVSLESDPHH